MRRALRGVLAAGALIAALGASRTADAQILSDGALIAQLIIQEQQAVTQLKSILQTLQGQTQLVTQLLKGQPQGEIDVVGGLLQGAQQSYTNLIGNLQTIGYTIGAVNGDYANTFPNSPNYQAMTPEQMASAQSGWQSEILASSEIAARSQTSLTGTEQLTEVATQILQATGNADGAIQQLQLVTEMLGVVSSQMTMLVQNLTTTGRAMVETGAATASERQLSGEHKRRNRLNYTSRGASVSVPSQMP
jgi:conjugal transfer/entry exclusion protein